MKYRKTTIYVIDISHLWKEFLHQWYNKQTQALWNITLYTTSTIKEQQNTMYTQPGYRRFFFPFMLNAWILVNTYTVRIHLNIGLSGKIYERFIVFAIYISCLWKLSVILDCMNTCTDMRSAHLFEFDHSGKVHVWLMVFVMHISCL